MQNIGENEEENQNPYLQQNIIDTSLFLKRVQKKFKNLLSIIKPTTHNCADLFVDSEFARFICNTVGYDLVSSSNCMFVNTDNEEIIENYVPSNGDILVFFVNDEESSYETVSKILEKLGKLVLRFPLNLVSVPKRSLRHYLLLEKYSLVKYFSSINSFDFNFGFIPLQEDVLSLERKSDDREILLKSSFNCIDLYVDELIKLKYVIGSCPTHFSKGDFASDVLQRLKEKESLEKLETKYNPGNLPIKKFRFES